MARQRHYLQPFPGAHAALPMSGLFLLAPDVDMKLAGHPFQSTFKGIGKESLFKRLKKQQQKETPAIHAAMEELLALFPDAPFRGMLEAAAHGDAEARAYVDSLGLWEIFLYDQWAVPGETVGPQGAFILEIERACKAPLRLVQEHRFADAAAMLAEHPVMRQFLWPRALSVFSCVTEPLQLLPTQAAVALEIRLSLVALVDVTVSLKEGNNSPSCFSCLIAPEDEHPRNPTSLFFQWLKTEVGASTINALLDKDESESGALDISTLKRWSSGSHQPHEDCLRALSAELFGDSEYEPLWNRYWASRYLNFIGYLAETFIERASSLKGTDQAGALVPWPELPFGYPSISSWMHVRYPVWLAYHRNRLGNPATEDGRCGSGEHAISRS